MQRPSGNRWASFWLVLAIVMMLTTSLFSTIIALIAYSRSYDNSDVSNIQGAQLQIHKSVIEQNRERMNRLDREIERLKDQLREQSYRRR